MVIGTGIVILAAIAGAYFEGMWIPNAPDAGEYPVRGIDVSGHQGVIQWPAIPRASVQFVYIKATEGQDFRDQHFAENWRGSAKAGLRRGAYHFFTLKSTGLQQAANFTAVVPKDPDALPPVVDVELWGNSATRPSVAKFQRELSDYMGAVRTFYGREPVVYTANDFRNHFLRDFPIQELWIRSVLTSPQISGNAPWRFWQFSEKGRIPGINGFIDQNVFHGDAGALEAFIHQDR